MSNRLVVSLLANKPHPVYTDMKELVQLAQHSFASPATNARGLADSSVNHIPHVMTLFCANKCFISAMQNWSLF